MNPDGPKVILWVDTFNNHFHPQVAQAATEVLEAAGYKVEIPPTKLCCGRPLYDFGMLDLARFKLEEILHDLRNWIEEGVPIIGLEPSCTAVFRDELIGLFPQRFDAKRVSLQTFLFSEFISEYPVRFESLFRSEKEKRKAAPTEMPIVTNGFSCREQIVGLANRTPKHVAEIVRDVWL